MHTVVDRPALHALTRQLREHVLRIEILRWFSHKRVEKSVGEISALRLLGYDMLVEVDLSSV